jgi:Ca-activated chloride channel family protein
MTRAAEPAKGDQVALGGSAPAEPAPRAAGDPCEGGQIAQPSAVATAGAPMNDGRGGAGAPAGGAPGGIGGIGTGAGGLRGPSTQQAPRVALGTIKVDGGLNADIVRRIVRQHLGQLRFCYEQTLKKNPGINGLAVVKFEIDDAGMVPNAEVTKHLEGNLDACLVEQVKSFQFPKPEKGTVKVQLPLNFSQPY